MRIIMDEYQRKLDERETAAAYREQKINKICPIMSRANFADYGPEDSGQANMFVECQQEKCALWSEAMEKEGDLGNGFVRGCAFKILAEKMPDGSVLA